MKLQGYVLNAQVVEGRLVMNAEEEGDEAQIEGRNLDITTVHSNIKLDVSFPVDWKHTGSQQVLYNIMHFSRTGPGK